MTAAFKSLDPARYQSYRRAASQVLRDQYREAPRSDFWRCTADVIYLLENENLREEKARLQTIMDNITKGIVTIDAQGIIRSMNIGIWRC